MKPIVKYYPNNNIRSSDDFYNVYKDVVQADPYAREQMLKTLHSAGHDCSHIAGIFDHINKVEMTWNQFLTTDWQPV